MDPAIPRLPVRVTATTVRFTESDAHEISHIKAAHADGDFPSALVKALSQRLHERALHKVHGRVLARRPGRGQVFEYEVLFSPTRLLRILVQPLGSNGALGVGNVTRVQLTVTPATTPVQLANAA